MEVYLVCEDIDLGYHVQSVHYKKEDAAAEVARENAERPPRTWVGGDGNTYTGSVKFWVETHTVK